jgi:hypothetical protein
LALSLFFQNSGSGASSIASSTSLITFVTFFFKRSFQNIGKGSSSITSAFTGVVSVALDGVATFLSLLLKNIGTVLSSTDSVMSGVGEAVDLLRPSQNLGS